MDFLLPTILSYLLLYKYLVLFSITFLAALALPIPSAASLMASAAFASQGYFNPIVVFLVATIGNIAGDNLGYWLARYYGKPVLLRIGFKKILNSQALQNAEIRLNRQPALFVFFSRFEVIATISVNLVSGLGKMAYSSYLFYEALGEIVQVTVYGTLGYLFGSNWQEIYSLVNNFSLAIVLIVILIMVLFWKSIFGKITK